MLVSVGLLSEASRAAVYVSISSADSWTGGKSFFASKYGFVCDSVQNFEVCVTTQCKSVETEEIPNCLL